MAALGAIAAPWRCASARSSRWRYRSASLVGRVLAMANRLRHLGIARVLRQPRGRLGDLLAGDAALRELCRGEHLGQQDLALIASAAPPRRHRHRGRTPSAQASCRPSGPPATAPRSRQIGSALSPLAGLRQLSRSQQDRCRPAASIPATIGRTPRWTATRSDSAWSLLPLCRRGHPAGAIQPRAQRWAAPGHCRVQGRWPIAAPHRPPAPAPSGATPRRDCAAPRSARAAPTGHADR